VASLERIQKVISEIANRRKNVTYEEIEWVANQLEQSYRVTKRKATHGTLFTVGGFSFMVSGHNPGQKQVKKYCVDDFIDAMISLGLYED
jgi:hypothetical protein